MSIHAITIRMPYTLAHALRIAAAECDVSRSEFIRNACYLALLYSGKLSLLESDAEQEQEPPDATTTS